MDSFKVVSWNIENCNDLMAPDGTLLTIFDARLDAISNEIAALDGDILIICEGPKGESRAKVFFDRVAPQYNLVVRGSDDWRDYGLKGDQWIWFLLKRGRSLSGSLLHLDRWIDLTAPAWGTQLKGKKWQVSYPIFDATASTLHFYVPGTHDHHRHPQVLQLAISVSPSHVQYIEIIGVHLKSKINKINPTGDAYSKTFFEDNPQLVAGIMNSRIKLTTEATDIRHYIEGRFLAEPNAAIIIAGDLNDGPGKERIESRFMYHDLVSNLQGDVFLAQQFLNHALFDFDQTARWSYDLKKDKLDPERSPRILLDHIMFTQSLTGPNRPNVSSYRARNNGGRVEHDVHHRIASGRPRAAQTSDHRPVSMIFDLRAVEVG